MVYRVIVNRLRSVRGWLARLAALMLTGGGF